MTATSAANLVDLAKGFASQYGDYSNGFEGEALTPWLRAHSLWQAGEADDLADLFTENGSLLIGDAQFVSREEIRSYLTEHLPSDQVLTERVVLVRPLSDTAAVVISEGGFTSPDGEVPSELRGTWVVTRSAAGWSVVSAQLSPIN